MFIARSLYNCKKCQLKKGTEIFPQISWKNSELACNCRLYYYKAISINGEGFKKSAQAVSETPASVMRDNT